MVTCCVDWSLFVCFLCRKDPSAFFSFPVTDLVAPGYSSIIKRPMDFSTMKDKVRRECYQCLDELKVLAWLLHKINCPQLFLDFDEAISTTVLLLLTWKKTFFFFNFVASCYVGFIQADFKIMCENAMTYNKPDTIYHKAARKLSHSGMKILSQVCTDNNVMLLYQLCNFLHNRPFCICNFSTSNKVN